MADDDVTAVRLRLAQIVAQAESDDAFRQRLADDPAAVLAEYDVPDGTIEEYSQAISAERSGGLVLADEGEGEDPVICIHTNGCSDFTCIVTRCGPTCYVTIVVDAPDA